LFGLVPILKKSETEPNQNDEDFIGLDIFLTESRSKSNRYTLNDNV